MGYSYSGTGCPCLSGMNGRTSAKSVQTIPVSVILLNGSSFFTEIYTPLLKKELFIIIICFYSNQLLFSFCGVAVTVVAEWTRTAAK